MSTTETPPETSRKKPVSARDPRLRGWRDLITAHDLLLRRLDAELRDEAGMSSAEYSALLQLGEAPGRRKRMSELADGIILTRGGVTRLVDRLAADGLVERDQSTADGRGTEAVLTQAGLDRLREASKVHLRGISAYYFERLTDEEQETIGRAMRHVADGIRSTGQP